MKKVKQLVALTMSFMIMISYLSVSSFVNVKGEDENSLLISECDTTQGWVVTGGNPVSVNINGWNSTHAIARDINYGCFRTCSYQLPQAKNLSGYGLLEWDMFFTPGMWDQIKVQYANDIFVRIGSTTGGTRTYMLDKITVTPYEGNDYWHHVSIILDNYTTAEGTFNPSFFNLFVFVTTEGSPNTSVMNGNIRFDNIYAAEMPSSVLISDCTPKSGGATTEDQNGIWSRLPDGQPIHFSSDTVIGGGSAITVTATYGTIRELKYTLNAPVYSSAHNYLEWDMRVFSESDPTIAMWETICSAYGDSIKVVFTSASGTLTVAGNDVKSEPVSGKPTVYKAWINLDDGTINGTFNRASVTNISIHTNQFGSVVESVANSVFRMDNIRLTDGADIIPVEPNFEEWDLLTGPITYTGKYLFNHVVNTLDIDASSVEMKDLYVTMDFYAENTTAPGDLSKLTYNYIDGYVRLSSLISGGSNYYQWVLPQQGIRPGWNTLRLPLRLAQINGIVNLADIKYLQIRNNPIPSDNVYDIRVQNVKLTNAVDTFMPSFFSDGMMFQQNKPMNIWGKAHSPFSSITAELKNGSTIIQTQSTTADSNGNWSLSFSARSGSYNEYSIIVKANGVVARVIDEVAIGELWLASGQSNMEFVVRMSVGGMEAIAAADDPYIRIMHQPVVPAGRTLDQPVYPEEDVYETRWGFGDVTGDVAYMSAIAYQMALDLQSQLNVPVGIINAAVGATPIETWLSRSDIDNNSIIKNGLIAKSRYISIAQFNTTGLPKFTQMTSMYNAKIAPLAGMNLAGTLWYQGESNMNYASGFYQAALNTLTESWSTLFGFESGEMPFLFSHLAPYKYPEEGLGFTYMTSMAEEMTEAWAAQPMTMSQIPIYDLPLKYRDPPVAGYDPIHPSTKVPVGERFADAAMGMVYSTVNQEYTAPVYQSMVKQGNKLILTFDHVGSGLGIIGSSPDLHGFAICGVNRVFVGAKASITSFNTVEVWSDGVDPVAATYAFASFNMSSNLKNSIGIPAVPFRTDSVASTYYHPSEWTYCDDESIWVSTTTSGGFQPTWGVNPVNGTLASVISYDNIIKHEGKASLKLTYTGTGVAGAGPVLRYNQLKYHNYLTVRVKNGNARAKSLELTLKTTGNLKYKVCINGGRDTKTTLYTVAASSGFTDYVFDLRSLVYNNLIVTNPTTALNTIASLEFSITDTESGSVYLDDIRVS